MTDPALDPTALPPVQVAGMLVPAVLVPRIVAAFRATYPQVTEGLADDPAVRAVLKYWTVTTLASYEAKLAEAPVDDVVQATRQEYAERARVAREQALAAASAIVENPPT